MKKVMDKPSYNKIFNLYQFTRFYKSAIIFTTAISCTVMTLMAEINSGTKTEPYKYL